MLHIICLTIYLVVKMWVVSSLGATAHKTKSRTRPSNFTFFSLSCIGEGNGNPLQCSCLENPRDRGAWWASVCGVTQSRTRLKRLSSSSSSSRGNEWRRQWYPTPVLLPGNSHGQRSLVGCSPWGHEESDTTEAT